MTSSSSLYDNAVPFSFEQPGILSTTLPATEFFSTAITVTSFVFGYKNGEILSCDDRTKYTTEPMRTPPLKKRVCNP